MAARLLFTQIAQGREQSEADFLQIALLIEQLKSEEVGLRVNATRALPSIAATLGPERTRSELLPFLGECTDDEDEVLLALAEQLGRLFEAVGGAQHLHLLLDPLEALAATDEAAVRDAAVAAMQGVIAQMSSAQLEEHCVPLLQRLANSIHYTARVSACGLFAPVYARLPAEQQQLQQQRPPSADASGSGSDRTLLLLCFSKLCSDEAAMVKRVAAASLGGLVRAAAAAAPAAAAPGASASVLDTLLSLFDKLAADDQDSVRVQTVDNCIALAQVLPPEGQASRILPAVRRAAEDESWRVRWSIANKFHELGAALSGLCLFNDLSRLAR
jgi:serine/threonine-protein phosphatase 2A regulatory subunit A